jgi:protein-S-isoprenylcysteine O-methyltransferase Ste14
MALVFFGPRHLPGGSDARTLAPARIVAGAGLIALGGLLLASAAVRMGRSLTPLPHPGDQPRLIQSGPFRLVRHPMYGGGVLIAFGWALVVGSPLTLGYAILLLAFLDVKSRREERWLVEKFPDYAVYRRRVRRLIPFLY